MRDLGYSLRLAAYVVAIAVAPYALVYTLAFTASMGWQAGK